MTQISHIHGAPSIRRGFRPSIAEAFRDGPKVVVNPIVDSSGLTQGELTLALMRANLIMQSNYYGDPVGTISKALLIIDEAANNLSNFNVSGNIDSLYNGLLNRVFEAKSRHISQIQEVAKFQNSTSISGRINYDGIISDADLRNCLNILKPKTLDPLDPNTFKKDYLIFEGKYFEIPKQATAFDTCISQGKQREWAKNNIFNATKYKEGSASLLYEFASAEQINSMNGIGNSKVLFHKVSIDAFKDLSGFDRINVSEYTRLGVQYTLGINKLGDISPGYAIDNLMAKSKSGIGEPITAATVIAIIKILGAALTAILGAISVLPTLKKTLLLDKANGLGSEATKAAQEDFEKRIQSAESLGTIVPIGLAALALGVIAFKK